MKKKFIFLFAMFCLIITPAKTQTISAKEYTFDEHARRILKEYNIVIYKEPEQFVNLLDTETVAEIFYISQSDKKIFFVYNPVVQSADKECIVMYGIPRYYGETERQMAKVAFEVNKELNGRDSVREFKDYSNDRIPRGQIWSELRTALQIPTKQMDSLFHFNEHVTVVSGKMPKEMFNADSLFFYDIPLDVPYKNIYKHCLGMISAKKDMGSIFFKMFFTDAGKKKQNEYIMQMKKAIWYNDEKGNQKNH